MIKFYYFIKPIIPRFIQLKIRRYLVKRKYESVSDIWPILPGSENKPKDWMGWYDRKKFAFIITHDVEHKIGYHKVIELMNVEKELGFKSSYNFIPERDYFVEKSVLQKLRENGFDYGVHGLYHDGKLFSSPKEFLKRSKKINYYLNEWQCTGFRAPAMHHNLELQLNLNINYDFSTFDTDPFEPQPDAVKTIFPFWVEKQGFKAFLEMPYTLPQDSTLFLIMQERSIRFWKEKLDWIAEHHGMALINVHPDYINFSNEFKQEEFPLKFYMELLNYVKSQYEGQYWNGLPKDVYEYLYEFRKEITKK